MTENNHNRLCRLAADVLGCDWNSFDTLIVSDSAILITGIVILALTLSACTVPDDSTDPTPARLLSEPTPIETPIPDAIWIVAEKTYGPDAYTDGTYYRWGKVSVPPSLEVLAGNPGNGYAYLTFNYTRVEQITCRYQGDSDKLYVLDVCSDTSKVSGSEVEVSGTMLLQIDHGDPSFGATRIRARLPLVF